MRSISLILGATLAGALALPAGADPGVLPPAPAQAPAAAPLTVRPDTDMMARRMARRAARVDQDIQALRAGLQLTAAQDALWPPVADAIHGVDTARGFRFRQAMAAAPSQVDGLKLQGDHMAAMGAAIGKLADATRPLVATFTADQKSRLPRLLQGVRLPKVTSRALDVPQDSGGSWGDAPSRGGQGMGPQGMGPQGGMGRQDMGRQEMGQRGGVAPDRSWGIGPQGNPPATRQDMAPAGAPPAAGKANDPDDGGDDE